MRVTARPRVLAVSGPSGAGKTTLLVRLIPALAARGVRVAAVKHTGHPHPLDRPGKDSARLRAAGAIAVAVQGPTELAWFGPARPGGLRALARLLPRADLVLAEGFQREPVPRIEVHREAVERRFRAPGDPRLLAVVSDVEPPCAAPWFTPDDIAGLADLVARFARAGWRARRRPLAGGAPGAHPVARERGHLRENDMATTKRSGGTARGRGKAGAGARRGATVREAGQKGGRTTLERRGPEFYSRIGRKGGKSSGGARRATGSARAGARRGRTAKAR